MSGVRHYPATIKRWVDADTADLIVDLGFDVHKVARVRIVGPGGEYFDAPEVRGPERPEGLAALERVRGAVPEGARVNVTTFKGDSRGKYGRWLAYIPGVIEAAGGRMSPGHG